MDVERGQLIDRSNVRRKVGRDREEVHAKSIALWRVPDLDLARLRLAPELKPGRVEAHRVQRRGRASDAGVTPEEPEQCKRPPQTLLSTRHELTPVERLLPLL